MTRARDTAGIIGSNTLTIDTNNAIGIGSTTPDAKFDINGGLIVTGIATVTTLQVTDATISGDLTVQGTTTILDTIVQEVDLLNIQANAVVPAIGVTQSGSGPIAAFYDGVVGVATFKDGGGLDVAGNVVATAFYGDGSNLDNVVSGIALSESGVSRGVSGTTINFVGPTVSTIDSAGIATVTIAAGGISTEFSSPSGITTYLDLDNAQDHKLTVSGITTISVTGGSEGDSHTVRIVNSGIATVGFSTYFLFPSGSVPTLPTTDGTINLVSFTVHRVGAAGTQLLAGAGLNYQ
jgi:hypothetical protein